MKKKTLSTSLHVFTIFLGCDAAPKAPLNAGIKCSQYSGCRANCIQDYKFPNGESQLFITCENGEWQVKGTEWEHIPPCERKHTNMLKNIKYDLTYSSNLFPAMSK